MDIVGRH